MRRRTCYIAVSLGLLLIVAAAAAAEDAVTDCLVRVRTIHGSKTESAAGPVKAEASDMAGQLKSLPYSDFKVVESAEKKMGLNSTETFSLSDTAGVHKITVSPRAVQGEWVNMTVHWQGPDGTSLLESELKVTNGKCLALGTDNSSDHSTVIAIKATCPPPQ